MRALLGAVASRSFRPSSTAPSLVIGSTEVISHILKGWHEPRCAVPDKTFLSPHHAPPELHDRRSSGACSPKYHHENEASIMIRTHQSGAMEQMIEL